MVGYHEGSAVRELRQKLADRTAMIEELVWALHLWAEDDETKAIHPDAERVFFAALEMVGVSHNQAANAAGRWLDLDWCERQRAVWQRRNAD